MLTVATSIDRDRDGVPNKWEISNKLNPNSTKDAKAEADNNVLANLDEFRFQGVTAR